MNCPFCHAENADGAVFCLSCGKRIDEKIQCPHCGTPNEKTALYCISCGERLDGKRTCPVCGTILPEGAHFCSACGHTVAQDNTKASKKTASYWLTFAGGISLLVSAVFALIFVFCLGLSAHVSATDELLTESEGISVYDFFSNIYKDIAAALKLYEQDTEYFAFSQYFNAAVGTLIAAGSFISVPICLVIACVRFARAVGGREGNRNYFAPAAGAYAVFLGCACALLALYRRAVTSGSTSIVFGWNDTTLAGIILGGILFGTGCCLRLASRGKVLLKRGGVASGILAVIGTVFAAIVLTFAAQGPIMLDTHATSVSALNESMQAGAMTYFASLARLYIESPMASSPDSALASALLSELFLLAVIALSVSLLVLPWKSLSADERNSHGTGLIALSCVLLLCAVGALVSSILFGGIFADYMELDPAAYLFSYTVPIVTLVFSALLLVVSVVHAVFLRRRERPAAPYTDLD